MWRLDGLANGRWRWHTLGMMNDLLELIRPKQLALCTLAFVILGGLFWLIG